MDKIHYTVKINYTDSRLAVFHLTAFDLLAALDTEMKYDMTNNTNHIEKISIIKKGN